ncbi:hypothetical protein EON66_08565, partial [archaeon]
MQEICESKPYNHKSDVWSCGCILYELCAQKHAFEASSITGLVRKILKGKYDPLPSVYSADLHTLVASMLQLKASARPSILQLLCTPLLQPYIWSYAARCHGRGVIVPYLSAIQEAMAEGRGEMLDVGMRRVVGSGGDSSASGSSRVAPAAGSASTRLATPPSAYAPTAFVPVPGYGASPYAAAGALPPSASVHAYVDLPPPRGSAPVAGSRAAAPPAAMAAPPRVSTPQPSHVSALASGPIAVSRERAHSDPLFASPGGGTPSVVGPPPDAAERARPPSHVAGYAARGVGGSPASATPHALPP